MESADMVCSQHSPSRIHPQFGQVSKDSPKPPKSESCRVLHKREARSYFANDSGHLAPESASLTFDTFSLSGVADVLAWESTADDIGDSSPRSSIEGSDIIPDWKRRQDSIALPLQQDLSGIRFDFHSAAWDMSAKDTVEDSSPDSSK
jgi:hypothetical protein